ncbi:MAG TPA: nuclear transport factor 2 family protein [Thermoleophilaceae bacterium]|jgi:ketosteroid isomerase-like protein
MSSEERSGRRREIVSRLYREGWGPGDFDLVRELLDDDVVWTAIAGAPDAGTYRGFETVRAYMQDWLDEFDFNEGDDSQIEDAVEVGERLVCLQRVIGTGKRSGLRTEIRYACVYTFGEDERLLEVNEYATLDEALEAASRPPASPPRPSNRAATRR